MSIKNKIPSRDGQYYDTLTEASRASIAWDEKMDLQKKQNQLLEQQNRLMEQQNQLNYQLEQEKIQKNYDLEMDKMKHEEKMRILRLFDDIGISKETYDAYINAKFTNELLKQKEEHLLMSSKYDFLLHYNEKVSELGLYEVRDIAKKYNINELRDKISADCYSKNKKEQKKKEELIIKSENAKKWFSGTFISFLILLILAFAVSEGPEFILYIIILFCFCSDILSIVSGCIWGKTDKKIKEIPDITFNTKKYHNQLNMLIEQEMESANELTKIINKNSKKQIELFYTFRLNHYNSSVEKLLIDVGFKDLVESFGLEYKKVNNSNKNKDGNIEDYIEYFETNSQ